MATYGKTINMAGYDLVVNRLITGKKKASEGVLKVADSVSAGVVYGQKRDVVSITTATYSPSADQSGTLFLLNKADGIVITLPSATAANVGIEYEFQVQTVITSNAAKWSTGVQGTDFFNGSFIGADEDGTVTTGVVFTGDGSTHDNISMNGTTTGARLGTQFMLTCTAANKWTVRGVLGGNGTIATPFATT